MCNLLTKKMKEFNYKPPIEYLFYGISGILISITFGLAIINDFRTIILIILILTGIIGIGFLTLYLKKTGTANIKIGRDFIDVPGRWKNVKRLKFDEIRSYSELKSFSHTIRIHTDYEILIIEKSWMNANEFKTVKEIIKKRFKKTTHNN